jgi:hypothetical protein
LAPIRAFCASRAPAKGPRKTLSAKFFQRGEFRSSGALAREMTCASTLRRARSRRGIAIRHVKEMRIP